MRVNKKPEGSKKEKVLDAVSPKIWRTYSTIAERAGVKQTYARRVISQSGVLLEKRSAKIGRRLQGRKPIELRKVSVKTAGHTNGHVANGHTKKKSKKVVA